MSTLEQVVPKLVARLVVTKKLAAAANLDRMPGNSIVVG